MDDRKVRSKKHLKGVFNEGNRKADGLKNVAYERSFNWVSSKVGHDALPILEKEAGQLPVAQLWMNGVMRSKKCPVDNFNGENPR
jgi:hypothetical protein